MTSDDLPAPFWDHITDLRRTLVACLLTIGLGIGLALIFYQQVFAVLTQPLATPTQELHQYTLKHKRIHNPSDSPMLYQVPKNARIKASHDAKQLTESSYSINPNGSIELEQWVSPNTLIVFGPTEGFVATVKTCFWTGLVVTSPIWMFFILRFIAPALRGRERNFIIPFLAFSLIFMCLGLLFSYYITLPTANHYLLSFNEGIGDNLWSVSHYLDYSVILLLANALAFELCVILGFLVHYRVISAQQMRNKRRYVVVGIFVLSAIFTPPDILTQILLAVPLIGLYELMTLYASIRK